MTLLRGIIFGFLLYPIVALPLAVLAGRAMARARRGMGGFDDEMSDDV